MSDEKSDENPKSYFGPYEMRDVGEFCQHVYMRLRSNRDEKVPLREALNRAAGRAYDLRLTSGSSEFVSAALRMQHAFLLRLSAKVTDATTWHDCIHLVHEVVADLRDEMKEVKQKEKEPEEKVIS